jgi:hypothetical protein
VNDKPKIDYGKLERLPRKWTPDFVLWLKDHAIVGQTLRTSCGATVRICENYVLEATPEEIEERKREIQRVAARLARDL